MIKIGDFVTSCEAGYWQLIDVKPKIATEDYNGETIKWKKGDLIGQWAILKKAFTPKMKPRIDFSYVDSSWLQPVSSDTLNEINSYFTEHPDFLAKFDNAEPKFRPMITNCWFNIPNQEEKEFLECLQRLPQKYTMQEFWEIAKNYRCYVLPNPPATHLLNFCAYPWDVDENSELLYFKVEINKNI